MTIAEWWSGLPTRLRRSLRTIIFGYVIVLVFTLAIRAYLVTAIDAGAFLAALLTLRLKLRRGEEAPRSRE